MASAQAPSSIPASKPILGKPSEEFDSMKSGSGKVASWGLSPNETLPVHLPGKADESFARAFFKAIAI
ncbi:hypothetical protein FJZ26_00030 [Candidatus Parvarchaeota archaeon]|nr:hypothetical protein [Candidatus Parvarchaeota archaeon]